MTRPVKLLPPADAERVPLDLDTRAAGQIGMALAKAINALDQAADLSLSRRKRDQLTRLALHELHALDRRLTAIGNMAERYAEHQAWTIHPAPDPQPAISQPQGES